LAGLIAPTELPKIDLRFGDVDGYLETCVQEGHFPGAVLLIAHQDKVLHHVSYGLAMEKPETKPMTPSTLFDLASLTKVVVTTTLALKLVDEKIWQLDDLLEDYLPPFKPFGLQQVTIRHLLTHTSGLIPWANLFYRGVGKSIVNEILFENKWPILSLICPPWKHVIYSDLNFILLGLALESVTDKSLDQLAKDWIFMPCGMNNTGFNPDPKKHLDIAPTEDDATRGGVLIGTVHDENAWAMEGVSGHAGLFSTACDIALFAQMILDEGIGAHGQVLSQKSVQLLMTSQTGSLNQQRSIGWIMYNDSDPSMASPLSPQAITHTGFTGTSVFIDLQHNLSVILLSNRVHPLRHRGANQINSIRTTSYHKILNVLRINK